VIDGKEDEHDRTALMFAARQGQIAIVQLLLEHNAGVDLQTNNGRTALMFAARQGHIPIVQLLLEHNADINLKCNKCNTA
jgi:ankyrin repeat protein